jgi:hypothetical protein
MDEAETLAGIEKNVLPGDFDKSAEPVLSKYAHPLDRVLTKNRYSAFHCLASCASGGLHFVHDVPLPSEL